MIIYPPFIGETIPAFQTDEVVIPFTQNPAVNMVQVTQFRLQIKDYMNSKVFDTLVVANKYPYVLYDENMKTGTVTFKFNDNKPTIAQYYKFQMAYDDGSSEFAYSTASIGRCIAPVEFHIQGLDENITNNEQMEYIGYYKRPLWSEPLYSYNFSIYDIDGNLYDTSGTMAWNVDNDEVEKDKNGVDNLISRISFQTNKELSYGIVYKIKFTITTVNNYTQTKVYSIVKKDGFDSFFKGNLIASQPVEGVENGYVQLSLEGEALDGHFIIERSRDNINWEKLYYFDLSTQSDLKNFVWKDNTIEQGISYIYSLRQYSDTTYSNRILSNKIITNFEDMFLSDGERQLRIQFNPKVSNFKNTTLEQKTDTIGSKYPYFFRNGKVSYKELNISGLISYHMDKNNLFLKEEELDFIFNKNKEFSINLTNSNYAAERKFKLMVLDWLNNGKPKLFRSPQEGNYIVRLMNISLSPNDTIGRLLHTFQTTAYEIAENNYKELEKNNLIIDSNKISEQIVNTISLASPIVSEKIYYNVKNLFWKTTKPNTKDYIELDGDRFYNLSGEFKTLEDKIYKKLYIPKLITEDYDTTFIFNNVIEIEYTSRNDEFAELVKGNLIQKWIVIPYNQNIPNNVKYIHYLIAEKDINYTGSSLSTLTIDGENVVLEDGTVKEYKNLGLSNISKTGGTQITMLASFEEGK